MLRGYLDGVLDRSTDVSGAANFYINTTFHTQTAKDIEMDNLMSFNRSLTATEIKQLYSCRTPNSAAIPNWDIITNCSVSGIDDTYTGTMTVESGQYYNLTGSSNLTVHNLTIESGATLRVDSTSTLEVTGTFTNDGTLIYENTDVCTNYTQLFTQTILEGSEGLYTFVVNDNTTICNLDSLRWVYNGTKYTPTNKVYDYTWGLVGSENQSFYWEYNVTHTYFNVTQSYQLNGTQLFSQFQVGECLNETNTTVFLLQVMDEDTLGKITGTSIIGTLTYWNPDTPLLTKTYSFGNLNTTPGYSLAGETDTYSFPASSTTSDPYDLNFRVSKQSIITSYQGRGTAATCEDITVSIYSGACGGTPLASILALPVGSSTYNYKSTFTLTNYTSLLTPGTDYCLRVARAGTCKPHYKTGESYTGDILVVSSQKVGGYEGGITAQTVAEDATELCMYPSWGVLNYDAYYQQSGGDDGFQRRWYIYNSTITNTSEVIYFYNKNDTTGYYDLKMTTRLRSTYQYFEDVLVHLERFYPGENLWRVVQNDVSDEYGLSVFDIIPRTTDYRFRFLDLSNNLLSLTGSMKFQLDTTNIVDLTYFLDTYTAPSTPANFTMGYTLDNTTKVITFTWSDDSAQTNLVQVLVRKETMTGPTIVCNTTSAGGTGTYNCNLSQQSGDIYLEVKADGETELSEWVQVSTSGLGTLIPSGEGVIWTVAILVTIVGLGLFSPAGAVTALMIGLIAVYFFGLFTPLTLTFLIVACVMSIMVGAKVKA